MGSCTSSSACSNSTRTSVDVVTTSEVSVSVTVDDVRRLPRILEDLKAFAEVNSSSDLAVLCVVGQGIKGDATFVGRLLRGDWPGADSDALAGIRAA